MSTEQNYRAQDNCAKKSMQPVNQTASKSVSTIKLKGNHNIVTVQSHDATVTNMHKQLGLSYKREAKLLKKIIALTEEITRLKCQQAFCLS